MSKEYSIEEKKKAIRQLKDAMWNYIKVFNLPLTVKQGLSYDATLYLPASYKNEKRTAEDAFYQDRRLCFYTYWIKDEDLNEALEDPFTHMRHQKWEEEKAKTEKLDLRLKEELIKRGKSE